MLGFYSRLTVAEPSRSTESKWWSTCGRDRLGEKMQQGQFKDNQGERGFASHFFSFSVITKTGKVALNL